MDAAKTGKLRRECFEQDIKLMVVKNTLMRKALESLDESYEELYPLLKGNTAVMFSNIPNAPAKLIDKYNKSKKYLPSKAHMYKKASLSVINI